MPRIIIRQAGARRAGSLRPLLLLALIAAVAVPSLEAQRRGPGPRGPRAEARTLAPVRLMLDERKALELTEDQVARLTTIQSKVDADVAPLRARLDSMRPAGRRGPAASDEERTQRQKQVADLMSAWSDHQQRARTEAMALLSDTQKAKFETLESDRRKRAEGRRQRGDGPPERRSRPRGQG